MKAWILSLAAIALVLAGVAVGATAIAPRTTGRQANIRLEVEAVLRDRPELVEEALQRLAERRRQAEVVAVQNDPRHFATGPKNAAYTVVEFFDYRCPYCKAAADWAVSAAARKDARVVFVEYPILSEGSVEAARAAVASIQQGRYLAFHELLMAHTGAFDGAALEGLAKRAGLDVQRLRRDMRDPAVDNLLRANHAHAAALQVSGTPAFFINGKPVGEGFNPAALQAALREAPAR